MWCVLHHKVLLNHLKKKKKKKKFTGKWIKLGGKKIILSEDPERQIWYV